MSKLQPVRGTRDIYGEEGRRMAHVVALFEKIGAQYGFEAMSTPIFEFTEVYKRPLGEASDIVSKEMYSFEDRGGEALTLRPEFTAGVCRAFISNGLTQKLPCRFMSHGPAFRYERPQKGRYRQFHQINAECLGLAEPEADVDLIAVAWRLLRAIGIGDKVVLHLNTLGDTESRMAYRQALIAYLDRYKADLSEDSQRRMETNPLRILDSKNVRDREIVTGAPKLAACLNETSKLFFDRVQDGLTAVGVPFKLDDYLVRGMDYYSHTAFEFITDALGAQGTVLAGGRYDGLVEQLGGPKTPGVGWAGGVERLAMLLAQDLAPPLRTVVLPMGEEVRLYSISVSEQLREAGLNVTEDRSGNLAKRLTRASKSGVRFAVILGEDEMKAGETLLKDMQEGTQETLNREKLVTVLREVGAV